MLLKLEMSHEDTLTIPSRQQSAMFRVMRNMPEGDGTQGSDAGGAPPEPPTAPEPPKSLDDITRELNRVRDALHKANKEAETNRKKLSEIEAKEKAARDAQLSDTERAKQEALEAKAKLGQIESALKAERIGRQVERVAATLKFINADDATRYLDMSKITFADDGSVTGVKEQLEQLAKDRPYLTRANAPANGTPRTSTLTQFGTPPTQPHGLPRKLTGL